MSKNKLRFKDMDGNCYPDSTMHNLGSLVSKLPKSKISVADAKSYDGIGFPCFTSGSNLLKWNEALSDSATIMMNDGGVANINFYDGKCAYTDHVFAFTANSNVNTAFLYHAIKSDIVKIDRQFFKGSGLKNLDKTGLLKHYMVHLPSLPEQQKIAALFSKLEERIELREQKIANLKDYKKGLQQAVFGVNGVRALRFKDENGNDYPEWAEKSLGEVFTIKYGKDQKTYAVDGGSFPIYGTGGIVSYTNKPLYNKPSVLIGRKGTIDKPVYIESPFGTVDTMFYTEINDGFIPKYVYSVCQTINWRKYDESTGVPSLNTKTVKSIKVVISQSIEEQKKIADLFSKIDNQIELEEQLLQAAKDAKQGLMQRVFSESCHGQE